MFLGKNKEILDAELWAISEALDTAMRETSTANNTLITIFCDSQKALTAIRQPPSQKENRFLRGQIYYKAENLVGDGHIVVRRWIPGHAGLTGNEKADLAAKNKAEKGGKQAERWSPLTYIKKNLAQVRSTETTKWHERKIQEKLAAAAFISRGQKLKSTRSLETPRKSTRQGTTNLKWDTEQ